MAKVKLNSRFTPSEKLAIVAFLNHQLEAANKAHSKFLNYRKATHDSSHREQEHYWRNVAQGLRWSRSQILINTKGKSDAESNHDAIPVR